MQALLLNGEKNEKNNLSRYTDLIIKQLEKFDYDVINILLREKEITHCLGNFKCWTKTPGKCIINDFGNEILHYYNDADLIILLNPITFGGYSYQIKKALDRIIPVSIPIFDKNSSGDYFYKKRIKNNPGLIGVGIKNEDNLEAEKIFGSLINRNGINLCLNFYRTMAFEEKDSDNKISEEIELLLKEIGDFYE